MLRWAALATQALMLQGIQGHAHATHAKVVAGAESFQTTPLTPSAQPSAADTTGEKTVREKGGGSDGGEEGLRREEGAEREEGAKQRCEEGTGLEGAEGPGSKGAEGPEASRTEEWLS